MQRPVRPTVIVIVVVVAVLLGLTGRLPAQAKNVASPKTSSFGGLSNFVSSRDSKSNVNRRGVERSADNSVNRNSPSLGMKRG